MSTPYLEQLRILGLPETKLPSDELEDRLAGDEVSFSIDIEPTIPSEMPYTVSFFYARRERTDRFQLIRYTATLYLPEKEIRARKFSILHEPILLTIEEAKNLLLGRAVFKIFYPGKIHEASVWLWLDLHQKDKAGDYKMLQCQVGQQRNLENVLPRYPIIGLDNAAYCKLLIAALHSGHLVGALFPQGSVGTRLKVLEYDPRVKILKLHLPELCTPTIDLPLLTNRQG